MTRLSIGSFILIGLLAWGLPAVVIAGPRIIMFVAAAAVPVWLFTRKSVVPAVTARRFSASTGAVLVLITLVYVVFDGLIGRKMFAWNMFLFGNDALSTMVMESNRHVSQGRTFFELLGACLTLLPLALIDTTKRLGAPAKWLLWVVAVFSLFYETGISRGYLLMAVFSVGIGRGASLRRIAWAGTLSVGAFAAASLYRGDFSQVHFSNPLFDAVAFPFINLSLMLRSACGSGHWYEFVAEFFKKFMPAFVFPKNVFSFNIEMTSCIYPFFGKDVESISIFTYLGEICYYQPSVVTAFLGGSFMGILSRTVDRLLLKYDLPAARLFAGLMCVVLLRSRMQDVLSFLVAQLLFLIIFPSMLSITRVLYRVLQAPRLRVAGRELSAESR